MLNKPQLLIGALHSGSGKTTFTMGLLKALCERGLRVQPFKCGPDYIDPQFHTLATGRASVNLDTWLASEAHVRTLYGRYGADADVCVTEGVMGLFDGYDRMRGSSAEIALLLGIPVVLLVDARSAAYTMAAQLSGIRLFRPELKIAGVIFNKPSSERHRGILEAAAADAGLRCLGFLPRRDDLEIPSRHLGLTLDTERVMETQIARSAELVRENIDLDALLEVIQTPFQPASEAVLRCGDTKIAVAHDAAFNFIYRENLAQLERLGTVRFFSPLAGDPLPEADLVYLPGGYPELFLEQLRAQKTLIAQLKAYAEAGEKILAECGGMMYLSQTVCGILPFECTMEGARLHLGYRRIVTTSGAEWRGHEFHYSRIADAPEAKLPSVAEQYNAAGERVDTPLFRYKNIRAGYTHLYWGEADLLKLWE
ncbi:MAG: cobyrinate a,c-diamide synthase [Bacteroidales bacterium]|nr:cobyrinate a,c-diamide synthase [Bacteroidales bacterium]